MRIRVCLFKFLYIPLTNVRARHKGHHNASLGTPMARDVQSVPVSHRYISELQGARLLSSDPHRCISLFKRTLKRTFSEPKSQTIV